MKLWSIRATNYLGEDSIYYFQNKEIAKQSFENLCKTYKNYPEYGRHGDCATWFDADYNGYSTWVELCFTTVEILDTPITKW